MAQGSLTTASRQRRLLTGVAVADSGMAVIQLLDKECCGKLGDPHFYEGNGAERQNVRKGHRLVLSGMHSQSPSCACPRGDHWVATVTPDK